MTRSVWAYPITPCFVSHARRLVSSSNPSFLIRRFQVATTFPVRSSRSRSDMARIPSQSRTCANGVSPLRCCVSRTTTNVKKIAFRRSSGWATSRSTESRGGSASLQDHADLRRHRVHDLPVRQSERPQAFEVPLKELHVIPIGGIGRLHGGERYEQTRCHGFGGPHVGLPELIVACAVICANALVKLIRNPTRPYQELIRATSPQGGLDPLRHLHSHIAVLRQPTAPHIP